jgi:hypothetical protein
MLILECSQGCDGRTEGRKDGKTEGRTVALLYIEEEYIYGIMVLLVTKRTANYLLFHYNDI